MKNIKVLMKFAMRSLILYFEGRRKKGLILKIMKGNRIVSKKTEGEELFLKKWKKLTSDVNVIYYRCFSHYIFLPNESLSNIISGDISVKFIEPILNPIKYRAYYEDKNIYGKMYPKEWLPKTYLRRMNGIYMDEDYNVISDFNNKTLNNLLLSVNQFIIKPSVDSESGRGVKLYIRKGSYFIDNNKEIFSLNNLTVKYGNDFIIQERLKQSSYISQFNSTSINTIRVVVYRSVIDDKLHVTNSILRVGSQGSILDNAHAGGFFTGINENGELGCQYANYLGLVSRDFNGIDLNENYFEIPNYKKIKDFSKQIVSQIPHHRLVALDIALNEKNDPILIESNIGGFSYWLFQFCGQITLDGYTDEIIDYCIAHKNNYVLTSLNF